MEIKQQFPNDTATIEWLKVQKHCTAPTYKYLWKYFLEFTGLSGDQILEAKKSDKEFGWERKVLEFKDWIVSQKKLSENSANTAAATVRGFFAFYRVPLQFRRSESAKLKESQRKTEDYLFNKDDLKKMYDVGDLDERYVLTAGKSFGLRAGDFLRLTRGDLEPYLNRQVPISIGEYTTQKERTKAYPFIDSDALPIIKLMIEKIDREKRTNPIERILTFKDNIQLTRVLKRLVEKAGIQTGNKTVRFHNLRKFLIDRISSVMSESKWKQIVGKKITEGAYVSADSLREDYARAMGETTFSKPTFEGDIQMQIQKEALLTVAKTMGLSADTLKAMFKKRAIKPNDIRAEIDVLEDLVSKKETEYDGADCGERFEQIKESQLLSYVKAGWQIVHRLNDGQIIVKH
jgi:integrase